MKKSFNKKILAAILAMGSALGFSSTASTRAAEEDVIKVEDYACVIKYQGEIENSKWMCQDDNSRIANNPSTSLTKVINRLIEVQYLDYRKTKSETSIAIFSITIDDKGNLLDILPAKAKKQNRQVKNKDVGAAKYLSP